jgi:hypothetical protein
MIFLLAAAAAAYCRLRRAVVFCWAPDCMSMDTGRRLRFDGRTLSRGTVASALVNEHRTLTGREHQIG